MRIVFLYFFLLFSVLSFAQTPTATIEQDTAKNDRISVDFSDVFEYIIDGDSTYQRLVGSVELRQDSVYMYCDSATIINNTRVIAEGNVIIQQGDSTSVFADSLDYQGEEKKAQLFGNVALTDKDQKLFTEVLNYDLNTKIATYFTGAVLTNKETQLSSKVGYFYVDKNMAFFKDSVIVVDPQFTVRSDTLQFNTKTNVVTFLGPTLIKSDSSLIYCESGFYDTQNNVAEFSKNAEFTKGNQEATADIINYNGTTKSYTLNGNARFKDGEKRATADEIRYDESTDQTFLIGNARYEDEKQKIASDKIVYSASTESFSTTGRSQISDPPQIIIADTINYQSDIGLGLAIGDVVWQDTSENLTIKCQRANYNKETDYFKATGGRPLLITLIEDDSLFMTSDTLVAYRPEIDSLNTDTSRIMIAHQDVRILKSNLQATCDSLIYNTADSLFQFYESPIIWSDTSQFYADFIKMRLKNNEIHRIFLYENSFIVNSPDEVFFNQIKGNNITAFFKKSEIDRMDVQGNAESVYYALDDEEAYTGVNKTQSSSMLLYFGSNEIERIKFIQNPTAKLTPMQEVPAGGIELDGFKWENKSRPRVFADLF